MHFKINLTSVILTSDNNTCFIVIFINYYIYQCRAGKHVLTYYKHCCHGIAECGSGTEGVSCYIHLKESVVYYIELQVTNGAGLSRSVFSRPILLDAAAPTAGSVKHGRDFTAEITYQHSTTEMHGRFDTLYVV